MGNWIDIFCASLLLILTGVGAYFGLVKSLVHLAAWIGGAVGVFLAPEILGPFFADNFEFSETAQIIFVRVFGFLIPFLALRITGHFINKFIKKHFSALNALGGAAIGLAKGLIPCLILLSTLYVLPLSGNLKAERNSAVAYRIYVYLLKESGTDKAIFNARTSVENAIAEKVNTTIDSAKAGAERAVLKSLPQPLQ